jgi:hypothetical protein
MNMSKYPVVYKQLKLILKIWEKSKSDDREIMIQLIKESIQEIEQGMNYNDETQD